MKPASRTPVATLALAAVNIAVAYYIAIANADLVYAYGFDATKPSALTAFTSLFLHLNVLHLLGNMVFVVAILPQVEQAAGTLRFLAVYFLGGLAGVAGFWFFARSSADPAPLIGASGAVAACAAYYNIRYGRMYAAVAPKLGLPILGITVVWLALQILGAFVVIGGSAGGQAFWAHLGGFAMGLLLCAVFRVSKDADRHAGHVAIDRLDERGAHAQLAATDLYLKDHPGEVAALRKKVEILATLGDKEREGETLEALYEAAASNERPEVLTRMIGIGQIGRISSSKRTMLAEKLRAAYPDLSKALLLSVIGGDPNDPQRPDALLALAGASEPDERAPWLTELSERFALHPACELARKRGLL